MSELDRRRQLLAAYQVARLDLERVVGRLNVNLDPPP